MHCTAGKRSNQSSSHSRGYFAGVCVQGSGVGGQNFPADTGAVGGAHQYWKRLSLSSPMVNEKLGLPQLVHTFHLTNFLL